SCGSGLRLRTGGTDSDGLGDPADRTQQRAALAAGYRFRPCGFRPCSGNELTQTGQECPVFRNRRTDKNVLDVFRPDIYVRPVSESSNQGRFVTPPPHSEWHTGTQKTGSQNST